MSGPPTELPDNAPAPRLCHVVKWAHFDGYGFNLHADKSKAGQYIGKVDDDSPAEKAGLLEGDRIAEVNGVNISNENHKQVVERIKLIPNETRLLVLSPEADKWYRSHNIVINADQSNIIFGTSRLATDDVADDVASTKSDDVAKSDVIVSSRVAAGDDKSDSRSVASAASAVSAESSQSCGSSNQAQDPLPETPVIEITEAPDFITASEVAPEVTEAVAEDGAQENDKKDEPKDSTVDAYIDELAKFSDEKEAERSASMSPATESVEATELIEPLEQSTESAEADVIQVLNDALLPDTPAENSTESEEATEHATSIEKSTELLAETPSETSSEATTDATEPSTKISTEDSTLIMDNSPEGDADGHILLSTEDTIDSSTRGRRGSSSSSSSSSAELSSPTPSSSLPNTDEDRKSPMSTSPTPPPSMEPLHNSSPPPPVSTQSPTNQTNGTSHITSKMSGLNLNMTVAEMKAHLASKKKVDPRKDTIDLKKKYDIIQNM